MLVAGMTEAHTHHTIRFALVALGLTSLSVFAQAPTDFRKASWGMTKAQVLATESTPPSDVRESNGELLVRFDSLKLAGMDATAVYSFAHDKLVRAKYLVIAKHSDPNDFIADYHKLEPLLKSAFGEPASQRAVWVDDSLQEERASYLDQDRATPESILPSDRNVGLAISVGYLKLYTEWNDGRTKALHAMTGADGRIIHQIEYRRSEPGE